MNLVVDIGNSYSKMAVFDSSSLRKFQATGRLDRQVILDFLSDVEEKAKFVILSPVTGYSEELDHFFHKCFQQYIRLDHKVSLPVSIQYKTPETLGTDRVAAVIGALDHFPEGNILVIDAGTCITYDFIDKNLTYLGGGISPGIRMRLKALHTFTGKLPLINWKPEQEVQLTGDTTESSILSGVLNGAAAEVDGIIDRYRTFYPGVQVVLTGGDLESFDKVLKNRIFADPNLVLTGLNKILRFNIEN